MYCPRCGKEVGEDTVYCPNCGEKIVATNYEVANQELVGKKSGLKLAAFIISLLSVIGMGIIIIPLLWGIPMTVKMYKSYKNGKPLSTGFGVCTILFINVVAGILILVDDNK